MQYQKIIETKLNEREKAQLYAIKKLPVLLPYQKVIKKSWRLFKSKNQFIF